MRSAVHSDVRRSAVYHYFVVISKWRHRKKSVGNQFRHKLLTSLEFADGGFIDRCSTSARDSLVSKADALLSANGLEALSNIVQPPAPQKAKAPGGSRRPIKSSESRTDKKHQPTQSTVNDDILGDVFVDGRRAPDASFQFDPDLDRNESDSESPVFDTRPTSLPQPPPHVFKSSTKRKRRAHIEEDSPPKTLKRKRIRLERSCSVSTQNLTPYGNKLSRQMSDPVRRQLFVAARLSCSLCSRFKCTERSDMVCHVRKTHGFQCPECGVAHRESCAAFDHWRLDHLPVRLLRARGPGELYVPVLHLNTTTLPLFHSVALDHPFPSRGRLQSLCPQRKLQRSVSERSVLDLRPDWHPDKKSVRKWSNEHFRLVEQEKLEVNQMLNGVFQSHLLDEDLDPDSQLAGSTSEASQLSTPLVSNSVLDLFMNDHHMEHSTPEVVNPSDTNDMSDLPADLMDLDLSGVHIKEDMYIFD